MYSLCKWQRYLYKETIKWEGVCPYIMKFCFCLHVQVTWRCCTQVWRETSRAFSTSPGSVTPTGCCPSSLFKVSHKGHQAFKIVYGKSSRSSVLRVCSRSVSKVISPSGLFKVNQEGHQSFETAQGQSARSSVLWDCSRSVSKVSKPSRLFKVSHQRHWYL